jgi:HupE / UreJ protein
LRLLAFCLALAAAPALAHRTSDSYLTLTVEERSIAGRWDIALRDLGPVLALDANADGEIAAEEVRARHSDIAAYALARLSLRGDGAPCPARATEQLLDRHSDGAYAVLRFLVTCPGRVGELEIEYALLFDVDPQHRGLLRLVQGDATRTAVFSPERGRQRFELAQPARWREFLDYANEGVWHIWLGFDHLLFLLSLLLPAVLVRTDGRWEAVHAFRPAFWDVFKIVTAFTIAHSVTLALATLGMVTLPSRLVESAIALSVAAAALNNLRPVVRGRRWMVAFAFGLVHGLGFATVLQDLGLPRGSLALALVAFNLGVELGQLAIVAAFLPLAFLLRETAFYRRGVVVGGSALVALIATLWLVERSFDVRLAGAAARSVRGAHAEAHRPALDRMEMAVGDALQRLAREPGHVVVVNVVRARGEDVEDVDEEL